MDPLIQYATTADNVSIAFWAIGEGPAFVMLPMLPLSNLQFEWQMAGFREWWTRLAEHHRLVRYDSRGVGLSERGVEDLSLEAHLLDLTAVLDKLGIERTIILAGSYSGPLGLAFAARFPERVSKLILWCTHACIEDVAGRLTRQQSEQHSAIRNLATIDWELFIRTYLHRAIGWKEGAAANEFTMLARNSIEPDLFFGTLAQYSEFDARPDLPNIKAPTLVLHRPKFPGSSVEVAKGLAAHIAEARLVLLEGESVVPFIGDFEAVTEAIRSFAGGGADAGTVPETPVRPLPHNPAGPSLRTLLFTDIEGHTAMMQRLGDAAGRDILRHHERITREALRRFGGSEVKSMGDGFLASFPSAQRALECAVALQRAFEQPEPNSGERVRIRVGVNAGEPILEDDDLFGAAVITTARIAAQAVGGQIFTSLVVRELVAGKGFSFEDRGDMALRGLDERVRVYELQWREKEAAGRGDNGRTG